MEESTIPHIVRLDAMHLPDPTFSSTFTHTYTPIPNCPFNETTIIANLTHPTPANVAITTRVPISSATLAACPHLKLIVAMAIGTDMIDLAACKKYGVRVCNVPAASNESVAEHAIALFFALRRQVVRMHGLTSEGGWIEKGSLKGEWGEVPGTCREEIVGIFGGGELGGRVSNICKALGMTVNMAERKGVPTSQTRPGKIPFLDAIRTSTTLFLTLPLTPESLNLISTPELQVMRKDALIINVARGGIVNEDALVKALKERRIMGAAIDVYVEEPAGEGNSVLVKAVKEWENGEEMRGRLVLSPHLAWFARSSVEKLRRTVVENIESWARGEVINEVL